MVTEYADSGTLEEYLRRSSAAAPGRTRGCLAESEARWLFQQLVLALDYCHKRGVNGCGLRLDSLLLKRQEAVQDDSETSQGQQQQQQGRQQQQQGQQQQEGQQRMPHARHLHLKIADTGLHHTIELLHLANPSPGPIVSTPAYHAPETMTASSPPLDGRPGDVWCLGVVLHAMLRGELPFMSGPGGRYSLDITRVLHRIMRADWRPASPAAAAVPLSAEALDLLGRIFVADTARRITVPDIMHHPWFVVDLLPGVAEYNDRLVAEQAAEPPRHRGQQTQAELEAVVSRLGAPPASSASVRAPSANGGAAGAAPAPSVNGHAASVALAPSMNGHAAVPPANGHAPGVVPAPAMNGHGHVGAGAASDLD